MNVMFKNSSWVGAGVECGVCVCVCVPAFLGWLAGEAVQDAGEAGVENGKINPHSGHPTNLPLLSFSQTLPRKSRLRWLGAVGPHLGYLLLTQSERLLFSVQKFVSSANQVFICSWLYYLQGYFMTIKVIEKWCSTFWIIDSGHYSFQFNFLSWI